MAVLLLLTLLSLLCNASPVELQKTLNPPADCHNVGVTGKITAPQQPLRIAIIGSGITGASAAFTLAENGRLQVGGPPQITVFERNDTFGGRITTTQIYGDPRKTIDTCAATFNSIADQCLSTLALDVGLTTQAFTETTAGVGVWNGQRFVGFIEDTGFRSPESWPVRRKLTWFNRYGDLPWNFSTVVTNEETLYQTIGFEKFTSLARQLEETRFDSLAKNGICEGVARDRKTALLDCNGTAQVNRFLHEVVEASLRERFFGEIDQLNALDIVQSFFNDISLASIDGGNRRLIDRLLKLSGANLVFDANVQTLKPLSETQWNVNYAQRGGTTVREQFDVVILAAPIPLANIDIDFKTEVPSGLGFDSNYTDSYVTHFTSTSRLNATFFNTSDPAPQTILTTTNREGSRQPPFFSLTLLDDRLKNPITGKDEYLYKLVSKSAIPDDEIAQYLEQNESLTEPVVSWIDREPLPQSIPVIEANQTILGNIEIAPRLFYAGGGERVAATVEFGCRMGRNAARLIIPSPRPQSETR